MKEQNEVGKEKKNVQKESPSPRRRLYDLTTTMATATVIRLKNLIESFCAFRRSSGQSNDSRVHHAMSKTKIVHPNNNLNINENC